MHDLNQYTSMWLIAFTSEAHRPSARDKPTLGMPGAVATPPAWGAIREGGVTLRGREGGCHLAEEGGRRGGVTLRGRGGGGGGGCHLAGDGGRGGVTLRGMDVRSLSPSSRCLVITRPRFLRICFTTARSSSSAELSSSSAYGQENTT